MKEEKLKVLLLINNGFNALTFYTQRGCWVGFSDPPYPTFVQ